MIEGDENLLKHASDYYYADLFGPTQDFDIQIDPSVWEDLIQISDEENDFFMQTIYRRRN